MADELRITSRPELERPVLIAAFRGWNDGGQGASLAGAYLARAWAGARFADIDPEGFYDFQATRPMVSLVDGVTRQIEWPENAFFHAPLPGAGRDSILLLGIEPRRTSPRAPSPASSRASRREFGVELVITLGSLLADVPHTRPSPVTGSATDPELIDQLGLSTSRYEGPTGMVGVLHDACGQAGIASASLWAAVPHYVSLTPSPRAAKALVDRLGSLLGADVDTAELDEASDTYAPPGEPGRRDRSGDGGLRRRARTPDRRARRRGRRTLRASRSPPSSAATSSNARTTPRNPSSSESLVRAHRPASRR